MCICRTGDVPPDLFMELSGHINAETPFLRTEIATGILTTLPKEPEAQLLVYLGEVSSEVNIPWHFHNGPLISIIVQGECIIQFSNDEAYHYKAGDVFVEPVGVVHRAYNPNPDVPMSALAVQLTSPGRQHIVNVEAPPADFKPTSAPPGPLTPLPRPA